jgi:protein SCO1/2
MNKIWLFVTGLILGLALILGAGWVWMNRNYQYNGVVIDPPAPAADFTLTDQHGQPFRLSDQRGKAAIIFFGYTNCPDVCPITLSEFKRIKAMLGDNADQVAFIYITVDPERDTVARLAEYLPNFDPQFIGLTGDLPALEQVWKAYGVYQQKQDAGSAAGYLVDHSTRTYLIDPDGAWRINFPYGMEPEKIVRDIRQVLKEN